MKALLLCAGIGTRMRPYTNVVSKPAIPLINIPIAYYSLHMVQQVGAKDIVVNTHHLPEQIRELFSADHGLSARFSFSDEQPDILDTGGAIWQARKKLEGSGPFIVANTDAARFFGIADAIESHKKTDPLATMIVVDHPLVGTEYGAVWTRKDRTVFDFGKSKPITDEALKGYHYTGVQIVSERVFKYLPKGPSSITKDVYRKALQAGEKILVCHKRGEWLDTGSIEFYLQSTEKLLKMLGRVQHEPILQSLIRRFWPQFEKRPHLWEGLGCQHTLDLGAHSQILMGNRCEVHPGARISGFCVLGDGVVVEAGAELHNTIVMPGVTVTSKKIIKEDLLVPGL